MTEQLQQHSEESDPRNVLADYLRRVDSGEAVDRSMFLAENPEYAEELQHFFDAEDAIVSLEDLLRPAMETKRDDAAERSTEQASSASAIAPPTFTGAPTSEFDVEDDSVPDGTTIINEPSTPRSPGAPVRKADLRDYELIEELGRGGMGVVYKAWQASMQRFVAIKLIRAERVGGKDVETRFRKEAQAAGQLGHPNIVAIHEIGEQDGQLYFSMDYVEGTTLGAILQDGPLSAGEAARHLETVARAVQHAHSRNILHRDLKPSNVLIDSNGEPKIADFGLAKRLEDKSDLTNTGHIVGTPSYMSPEQSLPHRFPLRATSDIYSLGAVLYATLTARAPFHAETAVDTLLQVRSVEPVAPKLLNPKVPRDLETVCLKCLEKNPNRRYQSADDLADELRRFLEGRPTLARPVGPIGRLMRWTRRNPIVATLVALIFVVLTVSSAVSSAMYVREARALSSAQETLSRMFVKEADLPDSPDLMHALPWLAEVVALDDDHENREAPSRTRMAATLQQCPSVEHMFFHDGGIEFATLSSSGRWLLTASLDDTARLWDVKSGQPVTEPLRHGDSLWHGAISPDEKYIATACSDGHAYIWRIDKEELVAKLKHGPHPKRPESLASVNRVRFVPSTNPDDPERLIVATASSDETARVWDGLTGEELAKLQHAGHVSDVLHLPGSDVLVSTSSDGTTRLWNWKQPKGEDGSVRTLRHIDASGDPLSINDRHHFALAIAVSTDGSRVATGGSDGVAWIWDVETGKPTGAKGMRHTHGVTAMAFSDDGKYLATGSPAGSVGVWDTILGFPAPGWPIKHSAWVDAVAFSPDSKSLVSASRDMTARVWNVETARPLAPPLVHNSTAYHAEFVKSDGPVTSLITASGDGAARLWRLPSGPQRLPLPHVSSINSVSRAGASPLFALTSKDQNNALLLCDTADDSIDDFDIVNVPVYLEDREGPAHGPRSIDCSALDPKGRYVATGAQDKKAIVWDIATGDPIAAFDHEQILSQLEFSPDGKLLLAVDRFIDQSHVCVWDIESKQRLWTHTGYIHHATFSPDQKLIAIADRSACRVVEATTGKLVWSNSKNSIMRCRFSLDSKLLATAGDAARLWHAADGRPYGEPMEHSRSVQIAEFSPDGKWLATGSVDRTARVWNVETTQPVSRFLQHGAKVNYVDFDATSRLLVTVAEDKTAYVWGTQTGELAMPPLSPHREVTFARFLEGGKRLLLGCEGKDEQNTTYTWFAVHDIPHDQRPSDTLLLHAEVFSGRRIDALSDSVPLTRPEYRKRWQLWRNLNQPSF